MSSRWLLLVCGLTLIALIAAGLIASRISTFGPCASGDIAVPAPTGWLTRGDMAVSLSLPLGVHQLAVDEIDSTVYVFASKDLRVSIDYGGMVGGQAPYSPVPGTLRETWCIDGKLFDVARYDVPRPPTESASETAPIRVIALAHQADGYGVNVVAECSSREAETVVHVALRTIRLR